ncbi:hypothetical protein ALCH109712_08675 [Alkalicoccus chagannorensis]
MELPPIFSGTESRTVEAAAPALAQSFLHWGFLAWAILGTLSTMILMYAHYQKGMPWKPRSILYPIRFKGNNTKKPLCKGWKSRGVIRHPVHRDAVLFWLEAD